MDKSITDIEKTLIKEFEQRPVLFGSGPQTLSPVGQRCGLWIFLVGIGNISTNAIDLSTSSARMFGYYSLAHVHGGGGVHWCPESGLQKVDAGDVVFSLPGQKHIYGARVGEEWREDWLAFIGPRADMLRESGMLESGVLKNALATRRVREIARLAREQTDEGLLRAAGLLELLFVDLYLGQQKKNAAGALSKIQTLAGEIDAMPERNWALPEMARQVGLSQSHLRRLFMQAFSLSPHAFLEQARLRKASSLLRDTDEAVAHIAEQTGYPDPFHFSARFRRFFGISPSSYRKIALFGGRKSL